MARLKVQMGLGAAAMLALLGAAGARAEGPQWINQSLIGEQALSNVRGVIGLNMAAGDNNAQFNGTAISLGGTDGRGVAGVTIKQALRLDKPASAYLGGNASIGGSAFAHSSGAISVNQASGAANAQANAIAISIGAKAVSDSTLAQTVTLPKQAAGGATGAQAPRQTVVGSGAFNGAKGIVQLNQSAGVGNTTANGFSLNILSGGVPRP